jgi:hypothetical protein
VGLALYLWLVVTVAMLRETALAAPLADEGVLVDESLSFVENIQELHLQLMYLAELVVQELVLEPLEALAPLVIMPFGFLGANYA